MHPYNEEELAGKDAVEVKLLSIQDGFVPFVCMPYSRSGKKLPNHWRRAAITAALVVTPLVAGTVRRCKLTSA